MKLVQQLCLLFCFLSVLAGTAHGQQRHGPLVTLNVNDIGLDRLFKELEKVSDYQFRYSDEIMNDTRKFTYRFTNEKLDGVLNRIRTDAGVDYQISDKTVTLKKLERRRIKGRVKDADGTPLPGVSVGIKGAASNAVTDADGEYSISLYPGDVVQFSLVGMETTQIAYKGQPRLDIVMNESTLGLEEVVVVGYGTQLKEKVTGAISTISGTEIKHSPVSTVTEALVGKLPGVQISQTTGVPGTAPSIRIRGTGSITAGNEPLYVVDGFPLGNAALSNFNMDDIESISVLKDASATSIYGSRGANGVIIITTKRGKEGKSTVSLSSNYGLQQVTKKIDLLSADEFIDFAIEARNNAWEYLGGDRNDPNEVRSPLYQISPYFLDKSDWVITDWQDEIFQTAPMMNHQLSILGGSDAVQYMVSGGYLGQEGILKNSDFQRYSLRTNIDAQPLERLRLSGTINTVVVNDKRVRDQGQFGNGIIGSMINTPGIFATQNEDGSYPSFRGFRYGVSESPNPMEFINEYKDTNNQFRAMGNLAGELELMRGFQLRSMIGFDYNMARNNQYNNSFRYGIPANPGHLAGITVANGSYGVSSDFSWLWENTLNYDFNIGLNHHFETLLGLTAQKAKIESGSLSATNFPNNLVPTLNAGQISDGSTIRSEWSLLSYLARANYAFDDRYYATATVRMDGSSRFGADNRWGIFPSISLGWMLSNEAFFSVPWVNFLKLHTSYGVSGNNDIANYGAIGLLSYSDYVIGNQLISGISPSTLSNHNLNWERSEQVDIGLDVGLLKGRINLVVDAYQRVNNDLLLNVSVPSILGITNSLQNIGKVRNRGLEFLITTRNIQGKFRWSTDLNFSLNRNVVLALGPEGDPIISSSNGDSHITEIGKPIGNFYGYIFDGVYNSMEEINSRPHLGTDRPGEPIVRDLNGDGEISAADRTVLGNYQPDFIYGFTNNFSFGNFDLGIMLQGVQGADIMNLGMRQSMSLTGRTNNLGIARDRWKSPEEPGDGKVFRAITDVRGVRRDASSFYMEDGSYLRVRNITLGYNFPDAMIKRLKMSSLRLYVVAQNPFTFTNDYLGYNPEVSSYHSGLTPGVDYFNYPLAKSYSIGLNVTF